MVDVVPVNSGVFEKVVEGDEDGLQEGFGARVEFEGTGCSWQGFDR